jgi:hypothetical protein
MAAIMTDLTGEVYGMPTYPWGLAPKHLATRRQLAAQGLRKGGHDPVAQMLRPRRKGRPPLIAYLYDTETAVARRPWTPAKQVAVQKAADSRKVCHDCGTRLGYVPHFGVCNTCTDAHLYPHLSEERAA